MPELPDIELYVTRLRERIMGEAFLGFEAYNIFVLRSASPSPKALVGRRVVGVGRIGKRIVLEFEGDAFCVVHLMIAGRLQWQTERTSEKRPTGKVMLARWGFSSGCLTLQEASTKKRASVHFVEGSPQVFSRGGLDVLNASPEEFRERVRRENRTLKRALTNPALFDGIGNAFSDEILFAARLSPVRLTSALSDDEVERLRIAAVEVLCDWTARLRSMIPGFPKPAEVTAFRPEYCVHGRYRQPCRVCGMPVQRISYAENETNYCAKCQNEGRLLADRALSRLLKSDWPKTIEELVGE